MKKHRLCMSLTTLGQNLVPVSRGKRSMLPPPLPPRGKYMIIERGGREVQVLERGAFLLQSLPYLVMCMYLFFTVFLIASLSL